MSASSTDTSSPIDLLRGGDLRSIGRVAEVVEQAGGSQSDFDALFDAMFSDEPVVQLRASDAVEKISRRYPHLLQPHKAALLADPPAGLRQEVYWHIPLLLPRLALNAGELERAWAQILQLLHSGNPSRIVTVHCLQGLAELAIQSGRQDDAARIIRAAMERGSAAVQARGRRLLAGLDKDEKETER